MGSEVHADVPLTVTEAAECGARIKETGRPMYQDHFGLQRHLFEEGIAQGVDVFLGAAQKLAVTNLGVALTLRDSVAVLTGPSGVGTTTLAAHTLRSLTTRLALGWVGTAPADRKSVV